MKKKILSHLGLAEIKKNKEDVFYIIATIGAIVAAFGFILEIFGI